MSWRRKVLKKTGAGEKRLKQKRHSTWWKLLTSCQYSCYQIGGTHEEGRGEPVRKSGEKAIEAERERREPLCPSWLLFT